MKGVWREKEAIFVGFELWSAFVKTRYEVTSFLLYKRTSLVLDIINIECNQESIGFGT